LQLRGGSGGSSVWATGETYVAGWLAARIKISGAPYGEKIVLSTKKNSIVVACTKI